MLLYLLFFNQKMEYEMRIRDGRSDVCSSDLIFDIAGVGVVRRRIDVDVAFLAVGTNDVDAHAVVTFHIGNRRRAVSFHGTFGAGSDLDAAVRRRNRSGAEDIEGLRLVGTERHDAAAGKEVVADAPGGDGAGVGVVDRKSTRLNSSH